MDARRRDPASRLSRRGGRLLLSASFSLIAVVTVVDILAPPEVHLGPFLIAAPAVTASFAGPRMTAFVGAVAVLAQSVVAIVRTSLTDLNHTYQIVALILISIIVTFFAHLREVHESKVTQLRSIAQAAQSVVLRPLPHRAGPLHIASVYLAAEEEAQMGGDLYAAARTASGTRLLIGDARGKGLDAISEASLVLGAFRVTARRETELPALIGHLEAGVGSAEEAADETVSGAGVREAADDADEAFVTALVLDIPDREPVVRLVNCGHPPPLLLRRGQVVPLDTADASPPLGLADVLPPDVTVETFPFDVGDVLLLYTDGVVEARDRTRAFYPLGERLAVWVGDDPPTLLGHLRDDLRAYAGGHLGDDAALVAVERLAPNPPNPPTP
ncbi:PP2C family protein-serine/threonine phosphatase [Streptomyces sp. P9(2023)]|uniref:PP2C family protein-serine/threonine phosphatase n=1 Tax=Streptomyces sp. P9(2023) TaxID=3064394 RepID=UPI0028F3F621|nr:PP2C family protein-serine/threonine phosphatase [Streptomyces sp. P9(2023)]MDT9689003.1 PP2C family protein-serine/threonine phosphatase [Streptomyces sp. P9(2023)]